MPVRTFLRYPTACVRLQRVKFFAALSRICRALWEQCKRFPCPQAVESLKAALALRQDQRVLFRLGGLLFGLQQYSGCRAAYQAALQVRTHHQPPFSKTSNPQ